MRRAYESDLRTAPRPTGTRIAAFSDRNNIPVNLPREVSRGALASRKQAFSPPEPSNQTRLNTPRSIARGAATSTNGGQLQSSSYNSGQSIEIHGPSVRRKSCPVPVEIIEPTPTRRSSLPHSILTPPQEFSEPQTIPARAKSSAYLQGKNPYGRFLERAPSPSPYTARNPNLISAPAMVGSNAAGRPRQQPDSWKVASRPIPDPPSVELAVVPGKAAPETIVAAPKSVSVSAAKSFWETRAQRRLAASMPRSQAAEEIRKQDEPVIVEIVTPKGKARQASKELKTPQTEISTSWPVPVTAGRNSDPSLPIPRPPTDAVRRTDSSRRSNPFVRRTADVAAPRPAPDSITIAMPVPVLLLRGPTDEKAPKVSRKSTRTGSGTVEPSESIDTNRGRQPDDTESTSRRRSTNVFEVPPREVKPFAKPAGPKGRRLLTKSAAPDEESQPKSRRHPSTQLREYLALSTALKEAQEVKRKSERHLAKQPTVQQVPKRAATRQVEPLEVVTLVTRVRKQSNLPRADETGDIDRKLPRQKTKVECTEFESQPRRKSSMRKYSDQIEFEATRSRSARTRRSNRSRGASDPADTSSRYMYLVQNDDELVPDDVDNREGYGRRITQDFDYPRARVKPRRTMLSKTIATLGRPWVKQPCGHFTNPNEPAEIASAARRKSSTILPSCGVSRCGSCILNPPRCRLHSASECCGQFGGNIVISVNVCDDSFAQDMGEIINQTRTQQDNTLHSVINELHAAHPSLSELIRLSQQLVQNVQERACCIPCPYPPPKAAQTLNVRKPGKLGPTINDPPATLKKHVSSSPDLIDLVESTADDLGVDLEALPDVEDEERFQKAAVEDGPLSNSYSSSSRSTVPNIPSEDLPSGEEFLRSTRREMTDLSEARSHLMDELDNITVDLQQILSKAPTQLPRRAPTQHPRGKPIDTVTDEVPRVLERVVSTKPLSRALTQAQSIFRKPTAVLDSSSMTLHELEQVPLNEIQQWLEAAQVEFPAAMEAISSVLEQLSAVSSPPQDIRDPETDEQTESSRSRTTPTPPPAESADEAQDTPETEPGGEKQDSLGSPPAENSLRTPLIEEPAQVERQATMPAETETTAEPRRQSRAPTEDLGREPSSLGPPLLLEEVPVRRTTKALTQEFTRQATQSSLSIRNTPTWAKADTQVAQRPPSEQPRKPSFSDRPRDKDHFRAAAPGTAREGAPGGTQKRSRRNAANPEEAQKAPSRNPPYRSTTHDRSHHESVRSEAPQPLRPQFSLRQAPRYQAAPFDGLQASPPFCRTADHEESTCFDWFQETDSKKGRERPPRGGQAFGPEGEQDAISQGERRGSSKTGPDGGDLFTPQETGRREPREAQDLQTGSKRSRRTTQMARAKARQETTPIRCVTGRARGPEENEPAERESEITRLSPLREIRTVRRQAASGSRAREADEGARQTTKGARIAGTWDETEDETEDEKPKFSAKHQRAALDGAGEGEVSERDVTRAGEGPTHGKWVQGWRGLQRFGPESIAADATRRRSLKQGQEVLVKRANPPKSKGRTKRLQPPAEDFGRRKYGEESPPFSGSDSSRTTSRAQSLQADRPGHKASITRCFAQRSSSKRSLVQRPSYSGGPCSSAENLARLEQSFPRSPIEGAGTRQDGEATIFKQPLQQSQIEEADNSWETEAARFAAAAFTRRRSTTRGTQYHPANSSSMAEEANSATVERASPAAEDSSSERSDRTTEIERARSSSYQRAVDDYRTLGEGTLRTEAPRTKPCRDGQPESGASGQRASEQGAREQDRPRSRTSERAADCADAVPNPISVSKSKSLPVLDAPPSGSNSKAGDVSRLEQKGTATQAQLWTAVAPNPRSAHLWTLMATAAGDFSGFQRQDDIHESPGTPPIFEGQRGFEPLEWAGSKASPILVRTEFPGTHRRESVSKLPNTPPITERPRRAFERRQSGLSGSPRTNSTASQRRDSVSFERQQSSLSGPARTDLPTSQLRDTAYHTPSLAESSRRSNRRASSIISAHSIILGSEPSGHRSSVYQITRTPPISPWPERFKQQESASPRTPKSQLRDYFVYDEVPSPPISERTSRSKRQNSFFAYPPPIQDQDTIHATFTAGRKPTEPEDPVSALSTYSPPATGGPNLIKPQDTVSAAPSSASQATAADPNPVERKVTLSPHIQREKTVHASAPAPASSAGRHATEQRRGESERRVAGEGQIGAAGDGKVEKARRKHHHWWGWGKK